jgi:hypothetical protein
VYWPALVPAGAVSPVVVLPDGSSAAIELTPPGPGRPDALGPVEADAPGSGWPDAVAADSPPADGPGAGGGPTVTAPLGRLCGARSGDKGGNANVGIWVRDRAAYPWLRSYLTADRLRALLPEAAGLPIRRFELPNLGALNFVIVGLLGEGVAASTRPDPQAKGLGEYLRSRSVAIPAQLLRDHGG